MHSKSFLILTLFLSYLVLIVASGPDAQAQAQAQAQTQGTSQLDIVSWGGAYQMSQDKAYFVPFVKSTDTKIVPHSHKALPGSGVFGGLAKLAKWDVADLTSQDVQNACEKALIIPLDISQIFAEGTFNKDDFLPGAIHKCGIASVAWSSVIVSNRRKFRKRQPKSVKHFFNVRKYPGKRALPKSPKYLLELALIADGVPVGDVYSVLDSAEGEDRAFERLDKLREHIVWWDLAGEALKFLEEGRASMAMAYSGRAFNEITGRLHPFDIIWDGQIYDIDYWVISAKSANKDLARKFLGFALEPERMAVQAQWFPYGPMRKSAIAMVGKHAQLDLEISDFIPTHPDHMKNSLRLNTKYWALNEKRLKIRFDAWLNMGLDSVAQAGSAKTE